VFHSRKRFAANDPRQASLGTSRRRDRVAAAPSPAETLGQIAAALEAMSRTLGGEDPRHPENVLLDAALAFIDARLGDANVSPGDVAQELGMSRATIYRLFAPLGGVSPQMKRRRLMRAWSLLSSMSGSPTIAEVACQVGFRSATHFSREFRRLFGISPRDVQTRRADQN
jgi:AraC-like DNA-binding protein